MKKLYSLFAMSTLLLAGCSSDEPTGLPADVENPATAGEGEECNWEVTSKIELSQSEQPAMEAMNEFGYKLMTEYAKASMDGSFSVSPVSVSIYLSMMANATVGDTHDQILTALGATDMDVLNSLSSKLMHYLPCTENGACLEINNRIWLSSRYNAPEAFSAKVKDVYNADVNNVDFSVPTTVPAINKWVSDKTHGLIAGLLYDKWENYVNLSQASANTVYFKGDWATKFDKKATVSTMFTTPTGKTPVNMMHNEFRTQYAKVNDVQMVKLYYENHTNCMELYLPSEGTSAKEIVSSVNPEIQQALQSNATQYSVTLSLPRFKSNPEQISINEALKELGITSLDATLCSPMGINHISSLKILHQTYINVDEEGTELAAVTGSGLDTATPDVKPEVKIDFNRPFMYIVRNRVTGAILMAGVVTNPEE